MESTDRTEKLLALILVQQMGKVSIASKATQLSIAGLSNV